MFCIDTHRLIACLKELVQTPSPGGYDEQLTPVLEKYAREAGFSLTFDRRRTPYVAVPGEDGSRTVMLSAHADTLGLMVRSVLPDGMLRVSPVGGINFCNLEGEYVTVHTRDGRNYTGTVVSDSWSLHVFPDARTLPRTEDTVRVVLDEPVHSPEDAAALGMRSGDYLFIEPRFTVTENGYVKSRFIDDKGAVACCFAALNILTENGLKPKQNVLFQFPYYEERGEGGCFVPPEVGEFVAVDIGLFGPELSASERDVSICAKDMGGPYDYKLTNRLMGYAKKAGCSAAIDVYYHYSSDAHAAVKGGNDVCAAVFGPCTMGSHGVERTHTDALVNTVKLILAYMLDL